jgi:hypothetical protein
VRVHLTRQRRQPVRVHPTRQRRQPVRRGRPIQRRRQPVRRGLGRRGGSNIGQGPARAMHPRRRFEEHQEKMVDKIVNILLEYISDK